MNYGFSLDEYDALINSLFFKKGEIVFGPEGPTLRTNKIAIYDTAAYSINESILDRDVDNSPMIETRVYTSLFYNLIYSTLLKGVKQKIVYQWTSTIKVIKQIGINPRSSFLMVSIGGSYASKHKHDPTVKQTLTFKFEFPEFTDSLYRDDAINLYNENDVITHRLLTGKTNKSVFVIKENMKHDAHSKCLKFFWIYDFDEYLDLSNIDFGDFEFVEFNPL
jgi:hypothetical protein